LFKIVSKPLTLKSRIQSEAIF